MGAQRRRAADGRGRLGGHRRAAAGLGLRDLLPQQRRAHAGAAAHRPRGRHRAGLCHGRPHLRAALPGAEPEGDGQRHAAPPARLLAARGVGPAEFLRPRELCRRAGPRPGRRPAGLPPETSGRPTRGRAAARDRRARRLATPRGAAPAQRRRSHPQGPGRGLCPLHPQQVPRFRRGLVGLGGRRGGEQAHGRGARQPRGGGP